MKAKNDDEKKTDSYDDERPCRFSFTVRMREK